MDQKTMKKHLLISSRSSFYHIGHSIIIGILHNFTILCFLKDDFLDLQDSWGDLESINCKHVGSMAHTPSCLGGESIGIQQKCQTFPCFFAVLKPYKSARSCCVAGSNGSIYVVVEPPQFKE